MGIPEISKPFDVATDEELVVTPYGAYPLMLIDRGLGLQWHHHMVSRSKMQSVFGTLESSRAFFSDDVASWTSWDTKVTSNLAALGGLQSVLREWLSVNGQTARFLKILDDSHTPYYPNLQGEDIEIPSPPATSTLDSEDWSSCMKVDVTPITADLTFRYHGSVIFCILFWKHFKVCQGCTAVMQ